jgi:hypothetical protein
VCWFVNLFRDDAWQPWALEFFARCEDETKRRASFCFGWGFVLL